MLLNKLAVILTQKNIKISRLSFDTGISRTTLTALSQNDSKRIDNDTLNTICTYLRITPTEFFEYSPLDFSMSAIIEDVDSNILEARLILFLKIFSYRKEVETLEYTGKLTWKATEEGLHECNLDFDNQDTWKNNQTTYLHMTSDTAKSTILLRQAKYEIETAIDAYLENPILMATGNPEYFFKIDDFGEMNLSFSEGLVF
ncbi:hypothetical protein RU86_GL000745 [Lactococcus piscium]|uniref:HTH cro/C1-type domain-containing protein n=1 Tax=Pseudolactococcus piscium TaxID=1364 RepID=A0A2A5RWE1_9LACT|nr:helix-turn-helix transcriptional regulator [Lactococcus piscium]PCS05533.1 hypothetical protein RU86_GL000745 [Lactococcus piscium]